MQVPTLCSECHSPSLVSSCPFCGQAVCQRCMREGRHDCRKRMGRPAAGRT